MNEPASKEKIQEIYPLLCGAIGHVVISWSFIEHALDQFVAIARQHGGGSGIDDELPRALKRKLTVIRTALKKSKALLSFSEEGLGIIEEISELSEKRHSLVHGVLYTLQQDLGKLQFAKFEYSSNKHQLKRFEYGIGDLTSTGDEMMEVADRMATLSHCAARHFHDLKQRGR